MPRRSRSSAGSSKSIENTQPEEDPQQRNNDNAPADSSNNEGDAKPEPAKSPRAHRAMGHFEARLENTDYDSLVPLPPIRIARDQKAQVRAPSAAYLGPGDRGFQHTMKTNKDKLRPLIKEWLTACKPLFTSAPMRVRNSFEAHMLHPPVNLQFETDDKETQIVTRLPPSLPAEETKEGDPVGDSLLDRLADGVTIPMDDLAALPVFELSDVDSFLEIKGGSVYRVTINGKDYLYKRAPSDDDDDSSDPCRAVEKLFALAPLSLRIPRVEGLMSPRTTAAGLLYTYIPSVDLSSIPNIDAVDIAERRKWYDQISDMVLTMHLKRQFWGDAKPENVVIDHEHRDAWLVDFDGVSTPLVKVSKSKTKYNIAHDLQGLQDIREFLLLSA
ncbi:uncharacterized protein BO97DRAFT_415459 [Aspergillus homomorphus CBS 101889]|uniref:Protein kinase domain-containing protein n=1 Tax=Aspergillus homomorphus (strain CBS 101889) TaxID=1450537 RepID=A0A395HU90_ASPHC|nr:hypothetical protein BO97DRAFT_415459 [Aspergillus homomorphus CBS 101889]RAL10955.1 hypothetical protein BO97DRAFT_415459 [Aspergillus homomorphus CBS 101889]